MGVQIAEDGAIKNRRQLWVYADLGIECVHEVTNSSSEICCILMIATSWRQEIGNPCGRRLQQTNEIS